MEFRIVSYAKIFILQNVLLMIQNPCLTVGKQLEYTHLIHVEFFFA